MPEVLVLDSFALLTFFLRQPGAPEVVDLLTRARREQVRLVMSVVNVGEVVYTVESRRGLLDARNVLAAIESLPIEPVDVNFRLAVKAARVKSDYGMGYLDCFVVALAEELGAAIVTGDRDFAAVEDVVAVRWLPETV